MSKSKKIIIGLIVILSVILVLVSSKDAVLSSYDAVTGINKLDQIVSYTTTTKSFCDTCPVKVIDGISSRQWLRITTNSNSAVYLYFPANDQRLALNLTEAMRAGLTAATSTITSVTNLINLASTTNKTLEFKLDSQWNGQVWGTTTDATANIQVIYSQ